MKQVIIGIIITALCVMTVMGASQLGLYTTYLNPDSPKIVITMINQEPIPATPGKYVDVRFKIENYGLKAANKVTLELLPEYPFTLNPGETAIKEIGGLQGLQLDQDGIIKTYKLRIDRNAVEGENEIKLRYKIGQDNWVEVDPFAIQIQTDDNQVSIEQVKTEPEQLVPGKEIEVTITIRNLADSGIKDISTKLDVSASTIPFTPIGSATEKHLRSLDARQQAVFSYRLIVSGDAEVKAYKIPLLISFSDELGTIYNKSDIIGLVVGDDPELLTSLESSDITKAGQSGEISVKFVNKGVTKVKFLTVTINHADDYKILSPDQIYVGNIDSDDYESAEFKIYVEEGTIDQINIPVVYEYKDANNQLYTKEKTLSLPIYSQEEAIKLGLDQQPRNLTGILIVIAIVIVGIIFYKKFKKKKEH